MVRVPGFSACSSMRRGTRTLVFAVVLAPLVTTACSSSATGSAPPSSPSSIAVSSSPVESSASPESSAPTEQPRPLVLGLGDSYMTAVDAKGRTFLDLFAERFAADDPIKPEVLALASNDATSASLREQLESDDSLRNVVSRANVIVISVGGNDSDPFGVYPKGSCSPGKSLPACLKVYAPRLAENYESILTSVSELRHGLPTKVIVTSADNPFTGWSESPAPTFGTRFYRQVAEAETVAMFAAARRHGAGTVDYLHAFTGADGAQDPKKFLAADHGHPGDRGIDVIASLLVDATRAN